MSLFRVISTDIGRPLADFTSLANDGVLIRDASIVLNEQKIIEREVSTLGGVWYNRLILPYRTHDGLVEGVVITFTNITEKKRAAEALDAARQAAEQANSPNHVFLPPPAMTCANLYKPSGCCRACLSRNPWARKRKSC